MSRITLMMLSVAFASSSGLTQSFVGQPIPFSHKQHAEQARLTCNDCHKSAPSGEVVSIPTGKTCMTCHAQVAPNSSCLRDLKAYMDENQPVPWVRVYEIPGFVDFSHKVHSTAGVKCSTCHGPVETRDYLWRETDLSMGGCLSCHRAQGAGTSCTSCHDLGN